MNFTDVLSKEFTLKPWQVQAVIRLLNEGNTIPFIARYRKEATGNIDDQLLRDLQLRLDYLKNIEKRKLEIEKALTEIGALTETVKKDLEAAKTLAEIEDIYRPFRPKRRTRASVAREKGLEPLAAWILFQYVGKDPSTEATKFVSQDRDVVDAAAALSGARDIIAETISEDASLRKNLRMLLLRDGMLKSEAATDEDSNYSIYYDFQEALPRLAPHRILAINRGEREEYLKVTVLCPDIKMQAEIEKIYVKNISSSSAQVKQACSDAWNRLIFPSLEREIRNTLTDRANIQAISVFSQNLHHLLMQRPIKGKVTLGVDPGFRTGCKLAVVDENGKVLDAGVGYFTIPGQDRQKAEAAKLIKEFVKKYGITAIAIGNGTASRESEQFIVSILPELPGCAYTIVSEAGASVYSASKIAAKEFPEFDITQRSAVSIARRMQDPLAELVKIDPRSIGVGQYQHDLKQNELSATLDGVVEQCVNMVGVEVSTASAELLSHVSGIGPSLAESIVSYREHNGIPSRNALKKVPKLGPHAFEQCAGFLRVRESSNPLDATAVHPESYDAAKRLLQLLHIDINQIRKGSPDIQKKADAFGLQRICKQLNIGLPTLKDIISELQKPGRDPRDDLPPPVLRTDILDISDLKPGMELTGTVRNVIDFGAFVDIGVHQNGLVHISKMSDHFIRHPSEAVKVGDVITVWVISVDKKKKRISLSMMKEKC